MTRRTGKRKKSAKEGYYRANRWKVSRRGWSHPKLSSNYRQTIVATDLVFGAGSIRRAENLAKVRFFAKVYIQP